MAETLKFKKGNEASLPNVTPESGTLYYCEDTGNTYIGKDGILDLYSSVFVHSEDAVDTTTIPLNADTLGGYPANYFATEGYVAAEIAKAQLDGGDVDLSGFATKDEVSSSIRNIDFPVDSVNGKTGAVQLAAADVGAVPTSRTINDKVLSSNITLTAADVGARASDWMPTAANVGAVPTSRTVNGKALSSNITLTATDVGAAPSGYGYGEKAINLGQFHNEEDLTAAIETVYSGMEGSETKIIRF